MKSTTTLQDKKIDVKVKLAALWASFMFLYIYVDYFALYMPGKIEDILQGKVFIYTINTAFLGAALVSVSLPALMITFSLTLTANLNRWLNLVMAIIYIPYSLINLAGEAWPHMLYGALVEVVLLSLIIRFAWFWPREEH